MGHNGLHEAQDKPLSEEKQLRRQERTVCRHCTLVIYKRIGCMIMVGREEEKNEKRKRRCKGSKGRVAKTHKYNRKALTSRCHL